MSYRLAALGAALQLGWIALALALGSALGSEAGGLAALATPRVALFAAVCVGWAVAEVLAARPGTSDPMPAGAGAGTDIALALTTGLGLWLTLLVALFDAARASLGASAAAGVALAAAGIALRASAVFTLGARFVTAARVARGRALATTGPYRWLRHPSELGLVLGALGAALVGASPRAALCTLGLLVPPSLLRMRREDGVLARARTAARPTTPSEAIHG
ncbi:MAG: hypothetical protein HY908_15405 [Myxococcales bacterium]|nr:hypothetical protein [Myxococcales bacterium]